MDGEDITRETDEFLAACQARGVTIVPIDNYVTWLQSLSRAKNGEKSHFISAAVVSVSDSTVAVNSDSSPLIKE